MTFVGFLLAHIGEIYTIKLKMLKTTMEIWHALSSSVGSVGSVMFTPDYNMKHNMKKLHMDLLT